MTFIDLRPPDDRHRAPPVRHDHAAFLTARERFLARLRLNAEIRRLEAAFAASPDGESR